MIGYTFRRCALSQHWAPVWILSVLIMVVSYVPGGGFRDSMSIGTIVLLPAATWITVACLASEPIGQTDILVAAAGSAWRVRNGKLMASLASAGLLVPVSLALAALKDPAPDSFVLLAIAFAAQLCVCVAGVAIGSVVAPPILRRAGVSFVAAFALCTIDIAVPNAFPGRMLIDSWANSQPLNGGATAVLLTATIAAGLVVAALSGWWTIRRR